MIFGYEDFDAGAVEHANGGLVDTRGEDLLGASGEEGDAAVLFADRGVAFLEIVFGWQGLGSELQHGPEAFGKALRERFEYGRDFGGGPKAVGVGNGFKEGESLQFLGERSLALLFGPSAVGGNEFAVLDSGGAGGDAGQATEAVVDVGIDRSGVELAFERFFHEEDAPARRIHLVSHCCVGGTGREAEAAVHAGFDRLLHRGEFGSERFFGNLAEHGIV